MRVTPPFVVPMVLASLAWIVPASAFAETIQVPPVTITGIGIGIDTAPMSGQTVLRNAVTIPSGLGSYESESFSAAIGTGDTIVVTVRPKEGTRFLVFEHPDPSSSTTLSFNLYWEAAGDSASHFVTPSITFDDLVGPAPTVDYTLASLSNNGRRINASMTAVVNGDAAFTGITFTFEVPQANFVVREVRNYASVGSSSAPSLGVSARGDAVDDDPSVSLFRMAAGSAASTLSAADAAIPAGGGATQVRLQARDASGTDIPLGGETVTFETTLGSLGPVTDHGDGTYSATLTAGTTAGTALVSATVNGQTVTSPTSVVFDAAPPVATRSTLTANPTSALANGANDVSVRLQLLDASGNPTTSDGGEVALATTHGALQPITNEGDGAYASVLTAPASSATTIATLEATLDGMPIVTPVDVTFRAWQPRALSVQRAPIGTTDGEPWPVQPIVDLLDAAGDVVTIADQAVTLELVNGGDAMLTGTTTVTAVEGRVTFDDVGLRGGSGRTHLLTFRAAEGAEGAPDIEPVQVSLGTVLPAPTKLRGYPSDGRAWLVFDDLPFDVANFEVRRDGGRWIPLDPEVTRSPVLVPDLPNGETIDLELRAIQSETGRRSEGSTSVAVTPRSREAPVERVSLGASTPEEIEVDADPATGITTVTFRVTVTNDRDVAMTSVWLDCCDSDDDALGDVVVTSIEPADDAGGVVRRSRVGWYWQDADLAPGASRDLRVRLTLGGAE